MTIVIALRTGEHNVRPEVSGEETNQQDEREGIIPPDLHVLLQGPRPEANGCKDDGQNQHGSRDIDDLLAAALHVGRLMVRETVTDLWKVAHRETVQWRGARDKRLNSLSPRFETTRKAEQKSGC